MRRGFRSIAPVFYSRSSYWTTRSLFHLDGVITTVGADKYFIDRSSAARNFLITGYDFDSTWTRGFPYKSAATISAPAGDTVLIAADINNFLYDSGGTPNQIPVVSLFQNIDYENTIYCKHAAQVLDGNGVETYEARVSEIFMTAAALSAADLVSADTYFGVPTEDTTNVKWVDPVNGLDSNAGTKISPFKTLTRAREVGADGDTAYLITGVEPYLTGYFTSNINQTFKGTGLSRMTSTTGVYAVLASDNFSFENFYFQTGKDYLFLFGGAIIGDAVFNKCRIDSTGGNLSSINDGDVGGKFVLNNSVFVYAVALRNMSVYSNAEITNNIITNLRSNFPKDNKIAYVKNNKWKSLLTAGTGSFITALKSDSEVIGNIFISKNIGDFAVFRSLVDGTAIIVVKIKYNYIEVDAQSGVTLNLGNEAAHVNVLDEAEIIGNRIIGGYVNDPTVGGGLHAILTGCGINDIIKYNYVSDSRYSFVIKTGLQQAYTSGGVFYNLSRNSVDGIYFRGVGGANCFNNTIVNDTAIAARAFYAGIDCDENTGLAGNYSENIIIKNNIIICEAPTSLLIRFDAHAAANGCTADYNIYYNTEAKPFLIGATTYSFAEWQGLGYDAHSIMLTTMAEVRALFTDYDNGDFSLKAGSQAIGAGEAQLAAYNTGLDKTTTWGSQSEVPSIITKQQGAAWDIGAYVH